jgi:acetamidase/formamidase
LDVATSRHIPEVSYVGIHHPGLMGTAQSAELLAKWTKRETDLIATDPYRVPPLALPPLPDSAILGSLKGAEFDRVASEAARTAPPRENGGNQDIKNLTAGSRVFYPVFVPGAKLSFGDLHFSQGDGEITFCGAIEMGGFMDLHVDLIKGGMAAYGEGPSTSAMTSCKVTMPALAPNSSTTSAKCPRRARKRVNSFSKGIISGTASSSRLMANKLGLGSACDAPPWRARDSRKKEGQRLDRPPRRAGS